MKMYDIDIGAWQAMPPTAEARVVPDATSHNAVMRTYSSQKNVTAMEQSCAPNKQHEEYVIVKTTE